MVLTRATLFVRHLKMCQISLSRQATTTSSGALLPQPRKMQFGLFGIVCAVIPGLLVGAAISKNIASFLEENDLFVPSDDDDDDD